MSFDNSGWLISTSTFSGSGGQQGSSIGFGYGHNIHPTAFHLGQLPPRSTPACYLCAEQVSLSGLVPSSMTSELVTVPDLTAGLSRFYLDTQFQQNACQPCLALGKLSQFLSSLTELENSIKQVKGHIESQVAAHAHQLQLITRVQVYEASISAKSAGSRSRIREEPAKVTDSYDQYIAESVFGEGELSSSLSQNSVVEDSTLSLPENHSPTNTKTTRKRSKSASKSRVKKPKPRSRTSTRADNPVEFVCSTCSKSFKTQARLDSHFLIHSGEKPFKCNECGRAFRHNPALFLHMKRHAGKRNHICDICGHAFVTKWSLTEHEKNHKQEKPHKCPHCDFTFARSSYVISHIERVHRDVTENPKPRHQCPSCPKTFQYVYNLSKHEINSHRADEKPVCCDLCGKKYADIPSYNRHKQEVHEGKRRDVKTPMRHQCVTCGKLFRTPSMLESHSRRHIPKEDRPKFPCPLCSKVYGCPNDLKTHQKQHEPGYKPKPRKKRISQKKIRLMDECRSKGTKVLLTRVDLVNVDEERRKRLLRRVQQRKQVYYEEEDESETESAWQDEDDEEDEETTESKLVVIEGFVPDEEFDQNSKTNDQDDEEEEVKVFVNPGPEDYISGLLS